MKIYLDMDGVLACFSGASKKACGFPHGKTQKWNWYEDWGLTREQFWKSIDADPRFWHNIEPFPWLDDLLDEVEKTDPNFIILTSPRNTPQCYEGKREWIKKYVGIEDFPNRYIAYAVKHELAAPDRILIDDADHNIDNWESASGIGILFPQQWNIAKQKCESRVNWVKTRLFELEGEE